MPRTTARYQTASQLRLQFVVTYAALLGVTLALRTFTSLPHFVDFLIGTAIFIIGGIAYGRRSGELISMDDAAERRCQEISRQTAFVAIGERFVYFVLLIGAVLLLSKSGSLTQILSAYEHEPVSSAIIASLLVGTGMLTAIMTYKRV